jgi:hypothetical protein
MRIPVVVWRETSESSSIPRLLFGTIILGRLIDQVVCDLKVPSSPLANVRLVAVEARALAAALHYLSWNIKVPDRGDGEWGKLLR